ncbi:MAG: glycosyltransferase family 4 protein [Planctomycetota bacterium]
MASSGGAESDPVRGLSAPRLRDEIDEVGGAGGAGKRLLIGTHRVVSTDGQGRVNMKVAEAAVAAGWDVTVLADEMDAGLAGREGVVFERVPASRVPAQMVKQSVYGRRLRAAVRRRRAGRLVLLNGDIAGGEPADVNAAHFVHTAYLKYCDGTGLRGAYRRAYHRLRAKGERAAFAAAGGVVAVSDRVRQELVEDVGVPGDRVVVIPNGVDPEEFRPLEPGEARPLRDEVGCGEGGLLAMFVGDLRSPRKGFGTVLRALAEVQGVWLVAVGGHESGPFPAMAEELGVSDRVWFLGRRSDVSGLLRQADVMPFPSAYEPFGLVVSEAMASGVPVVCGPEVGAGGLIREGGMKLRGHDDVAGLASALAGLRDDPARLERMRWAARDEVMGATWGAMGQAYVELLERCYLGRVDGGVT